MGGDQDFKLSEKLEKQVAHLTYPKQETPIHDPFPVCPAKKMPKSEVDRVVSRLHDGAKEHKEKNAEELEARYDVKAAPVKLSGDDLLSSIDRQYTQEMERRKQRDEAAKERYLFKSNHKPKVVSNDEFVQRMYHDRIAQEKATEEKLYQRYIVPTEIQLPNVSRARIEAASDRLSKRE